jgi:3-oxoacyl-[acyl-carrier protein] reductase
MTSLSGNAVITGARSGIGLAILDKFASCGINVWAVVHRQDEAFLSHLEHLQRDFPVWIKVVQMELSAPESIKAGVKIILQDKLPIDILVNAAGIVGENRLFQMTKLEDIRKVFEVNFFAPIQMTQLLSRVMVRQKRGSVINIASVAGLDGDPAQMEYSASKAALICATKKMALELGSSGVRVNAIAPGITETKMLDAMDESVKQDMVARTALKRIGQPAEIAELCYFLSQKESSYITGQTIRIDGGLMTCKA